MPDLPQLLASVSTICRVIASKVDGSCSPMISSSPQPGNAQMFYSNSAAALIS